MPFGYLLSSTCRRCYQRTGLLKRTHPECALAFNTGWQEMVQLAAEAAGSLDFDETQLRLTMADIAQRSYRNGDTVTQALEADWKLGVDHSMADGIITQDEEAWLREFRDQPGPRHRHRRLRGNGPPRQGIPRPADAVRHRGLRRRRPPREPRRHPPGVKPEPRRLSQAWSKPGIAAV